MSWAGVSGVRWGLLGLLVLRIAGATELSFDTTEVTVHAPQGAQVSLVGDGLSLKTKHAEKDPLQWTVDHQGKRLSVEVWAEIKENNQVRSAASSFVIEKAVHEIRFKRADFSVAKRAYLEFQLPHSAALKLDGHSINTHDGRFRGMTPYLFQSTFYYLMSVQMKQDVIEKRIELSPGEKKTIHLTEMDFKRPHPGYLFFSIPGFVPVSKKDPNGTGKKRLDYRDHIIESKPLPLGEQETREVEVYTLNELGHVLVHRKEYVMVGGRITNVDLTFSDFIRDPGGVRTRAQLK